MIWMTRHNEFAADKYSVEQGYGLALRMGLIGIHINNAANVNPDPLFAALKFTHPALVERLAAIDACMAENVNLPKGTDSAEIHKAYKEAWKEKIVARHGEEAFDEQGDYVKYEPIQEEEEDNEDGQIVENGPIEEGGEAETGSKFAYLEADLAKVTDDYDDRFKKIE